jgi:uncharacterized Tic20 family protein
MPIEFRCVRCGKSLRTGDETAGQPAKCPACGETLTVPADAVVAVEVVPDGDSPSPPPLPSAAVPSALELQTRQWAMFLHLSQLANYVMPFGGLIAPIIIWQIKKTELPGIDAHGKIVMNWLISAMIYGIVAFLSVFVLIGFVILPVLVVLTVVFPIIGGIKANNGELWKYPLSIPFF